VEWHDGGIPEIEVILVIVMSLLLEDEMVDLHLGEQVECLVVDPEGNHVDAVEVAAEEDHLENRKEKQEVLHVEEDGIREGDRERKEGTVMMINMTITMMNTMNDHEEDDLRERHSEENGNREENQEVELVHLQEEGEEVVDVVEAEGEDVVAIVAVWMIWTWKWKNVVQEEVEPMQEREGEEDVVVVEVPIDERIPILRMIWVLLLAAEEVVVVEKHVVEVVVADVEEE